MMNMLHKTRKNITLKHEKYYNRTLPPPLLPHIPTDGDRLTQAKY